MRHTLCPILIAASALLALPGAANAAAGSVNDFRLPQGGSQATPPPERQGPVAPDVPESQTTPTATPTPTTTPVPSPAPVQPTAGATPRPVITLPAPARSTAPASVRPLAPVPGQVAAPAAGQVATPTATPSATPTAGPLGTTAAPLPQPTASPSPPLLTNGEEDSGWLTWVLGAAALLVGAGLAWLFFRKRIGPARQPETPVVERPRAAPLPAADPAMVPEPAPIARAQPREPLQVTLIPVRMSLTLVNAVLNWEAELANHGSAPLTGLTITADMISAHADLSVEDRNSGPASGADSQLLGLLAPGEQRIAKGEIRLPFPHIVPIWHGEIALLMPLLRLRISADGITPVTRIFLVGQPSPTDAATLQPFRLDLGPRVYPDLAQRIFA